MFFVVSCFFITQVDKLLNAHRTNRFLRNSKTERGINSYGLGKEKVVEFCVN